jgi:hypothetical protein
MYAVSIPLQLAFLTATQTHILYQHAKQYQHVKQRERSGVHCCMILIAVHLYITVCLALCMCSNLDKEELAEACGITVKQVYNSILLLQ